MGLNATCTNCYSNKAYFNGVSYECPICKNIWKANLKSNIFDFCINFDKCLTVLTKIEKLRIKDFNCIDALKKNYVPSWNFYKNSFIDEESDDEILFYADICKTLILTNSYAEIIKIKTNQNLSIERVNSLIYSAIEEYLETRDELHFYPTIEEWSQYINAPHNIIEEILKNKKPHLLNMLPDPDEVNFSIYFDSKMKTLYKALRKRSEYFELSYQDLQDAFGDLTNGERNNYLNPSVYVELKDYFNVELDLIKKYRMDLNNWKNGSLDQFYKVANENKLSNIDTVSLVLECYFKELTNLDF
jgi:hypothetical protein